MIESDDTVLQPDLFGAAAAPHGRKRDAALAERLRELARPDMVRVSPDRHAWIPARHVEQPPKYCLCRWSRGSDGHYSPLPVAGRWMRLTDELVAGLGFSHGRRRTRWDTLMRLGRAGYIDIVHLSPGCWMLDLDSWFRHLAACAEDPELWDEDGEDRKNYLHVNGLGGWKARQKRTVSGKR